MTEWDEVAEARERGRMDALDALRDALRWRWSEAQQVFDWIQQDREGRDRTGLRSDRLLEQSSTLSDALHELHCHRFRGAWDRERAYLRERFERGEL